MIGPGSTARIVPATIAVRRSIARSTASISRTTVTAPIAAFSSSPAVGRTPNTLYTPPSTVLYPGGQRAVGPPVSGT
jgi:hypothetical protein